MNLMEKFLQDRRKLEAYKKIEYHESNGNNYIYIEDPRFLAGFAGYLKFQCLKQKICTKVFCRGQTNDFKIIPSLLRDLDGIISDDEIIQRRLKAYKELINKIPLLYTPYRFRLEKITPILQHYGIRTPWIDLVDNIYIAIWFATNQFKLNENGKGYFEKSCKEFGWIYFMGIKDGLEYYDLREKHSSLSLRIHVQHGISVTRNNNDWDLRNRDLKDFIIAKVKIPNNKNWNLNNFIFTTDFLFPNVNLDNTYKCLKKNIFSILLQEITEKYNLKQIEMGNIVDYLS